MTRNQIDFAKHKESMRHNLEMEQQGRLTIDESVRHNKKSEDIGYANVGLGYSNLSELSRHNQQSEAVNWFTAQNLAYLQGEQAGYYDALRAKTGSEVGVAQRNATTNALNYMVNLKSVLESGRHNVTAENETRRHNVANEAIQNWGALADLKRAKASEVSANAAKSQAESKSKTVDTENIRNLGGIIGIWR